MINEIIIASMMCLPGVPDKPTGKEYDVPKMYAVLEYEREEVEVNNRRTRRSRKKKVRYKVKRL